MFAFTIKYLATINLFIHPCISLFIYLNTTSSGRPGVDVLEKLVVYEATYAENSRRSRGTLPGTTLEHVNLDVHVTLQDHSVECVTIRDSSSDADEQAVVNLISPSPKKKKR